jgi:hypothetical protein
MITAHADRKGRVRISVSGYGTEGRYSGEMGGGGKSVGAKGHRGEGA